MRKPTPDNLAALYGLLEAARSKTTLRRWIKELPRRPKGGRPAANDDVWLPWFEALCRHWGRQGIPRFTVLKMLARNGFCAGDRKMVNGAPQEKAVASIARRFRRKLQKRRFTDEDLLRAGYPQPRNQAKPPEG